MKPKILFLDLEGTLLKKAYHLDNGKVAPSAWTLLAEALGPECLEEEERSKDTFLSGGYRGYMDWMADSVRIHRKYGLTRSLFNEVMGSVEFMNGATELVSYAKSRGMITALISGGFKALADRAQLTLGLDHALSGCEYFFCNDTELIRHINLLPSDYDGKVSFMRSVLFEYGLSKEDAAFVGDGKNDAALASEVGLSIAFNAQSELQSACSHQINQPKDEESLVAAIELLEGAWK